MTKIARGWRILRTGGCYIAFGIGAAIVILTAAVLRVMPAGSAARRHRRMRRVVSLFFRMFLALARRAGLLDYRVQGTAFLRTPGCLIIANHPSLIDVVFLIALLPQADCIVKNALWRNPFVGLALRQAGYTSNAAGAELIERGRLSLAAGNALIIFPEGTRSRPGEPLRLQRGAAHIALAAKADIVAVVIRFSEPALTKGRPWYHVPSGKVRVTIQAECPFRVDTGSNDLHASVGARRLTGEFQRYFTQALV